MNDAQWANFKSVIDQAHSYFNQQAITWMRLSNNLQRYGEGSDKSNKYTAINLKCLVGSNFFRTWPVTTGSSSGEVDKENMVAIFNMQYLDDLGYITADQQFAFRPNEDYFIMNGQRYRSAGDILTAQAKDKNLMLYVIMRREETMTGEPKYV
jgi:hypothetical protein